ncbi:MAG: hypothetical protein COA88_12940 [Kordia sp.]|nr:MAG: hypothetical protein COA88_12940 [Kordia sp.]
MLNVKEKIFLNKILFEYPEIKKEVDKSSSDLKLAALLYCFLGDKARNINNRACDNPDFAKKLQNIVLLYYNNRLYCK